MIALDHFPSVTSAAAASSRAAVPRAEDHLGDPATSSRPGRHLFEPFCPEHLTAPP